MDYFSKKVVEGKLVEESHLERLLWFVLFPMLAIVILFFYRLLAQETSQAVTNCQKERDTPTRPYSCTDSQFDDYPHVLGLFKEFLYFKHQ